MQFIDITGNVVFDFSFNMVVGTYLLGWFWGTSITILKRLFR